MDGNGSPLFAMTWRPLDMPSGPPVCQLAASVRPTGDIDFSGLRTFQTSDGATVTVDATDYPFVTQWKWRLNSKGYVRRNTRQGSILLHRILMSATDEEIVDHEDRNPLNCRRGNLRVATYSQNNHNRTSKFDGVRQPQGRTRWHVQVAINGKIHWVGSFATKEEGLEAKKAFLLKNGILTPLTASAWPTASSRDHKGGYQGGRMRNGAISTDTLDVAARLAAWPTPTAGNADGSQMGKEASSTGRRPDGTKATVALPSVARLAACGTTQNGFPAATASGGQLSPAFSLSLMMFPAEWESCAPQATQSSRRSAPNSSKPT